jgi:hypothetical protein
LKLTAFDSTFSSRVARGMTTLAFASGSNSGEGDLLGDTDVVGRPGAYSVIGLRNQVSLGSNVGGTAIGDVLSIVSTSPRIAKFATPSNSLSFGSNSSRVSEGPSAGAGTSVARFDHVHDGIGTITASASNTMQRGTFHLRSGSGIALNLSDTDGDGEFDTVTLSATGGGGAFSGDAGDVPASSAGYGNSSGSDVQAILDDFDAAISAGGGPAAIPTFSKRAVNTGNVQNLGLTMTAPTPGRVLLLVCGSNGRAPTSITQTNVTWTLLTSYAAAATQTESIWKGVVGASPGTSITINHPSANWTEAQVVELPYADLTYVSRAVNGGQNIGNAITHYKVGPYASTAGRLLVLGMTESSGTAPLTPFLTVPYLPLSFSGGTGVSAIAFAPGGDVYGWSPSGTGGNIAVSFVLAELTITP